MPKNNFINGEKVEVYDLYDDNSDEWFPSEYIGYSKELEIHVVCTLDWDEQKIIEVSDEFIRALSA